MKVAFYTLGCKVNQAEAGALQKMFLDRGHTIVPSHEKADLYVITTCTVTASSDKKCRQTIRRARRENPDALVAVCGCFSQTKPGEAQALGADIVLGVTGRKDLPRLAEEYKENEGRALQKQIADVSDFRTFEPLSFGSNQGRTRALLKIQDGCDNFCAYCIIPYARGRSRSLPSDDVLSEALRLKSEGFLEIVVTGIEISSYGKDLPEKIPLHALVRRILAEVPGVRIRLGSLEPGTVDDRFCEALKGLGNLCPHFHLSLQSGSDRILSRMGRRYTSGDYLSAVRRLYAAFPGCAVAADLIVGFPGETEEDFQQSLALIRECSLFSVHVFPYSRRKGTKAARMTGQTEKTVRDRRVRDALREAAALKAAFLKAQAGKTEDVLFESRNGAYYTGHAKNYCPVRVAAAENPKNTLRPVRITHSDGEYLYGRLL